MRANKNSNSRLLIRLAGLGVVEASLDQQYLQLLGAVAAGGPDGAGGLALETAGGAQRMTFQNGSAAPK